MTTSILLYSFIFKIIIVIVNSREFFFELLPNEHFLMILYFDFLKIQCNFVEVLPVLLCKVLGTFLWNILGLRFFVEFFELFLLFLEGQL